jgi:hypothetical protein
VHVVYHVTLRVRLIPRRGDVIQVYERRFAARLRQSLQLLGIRPVQRLLRVRAVPVLYIPEYRMYRCAGCRTAFVWPAPADDQLTRFYQTYHLSDAEGGSYDAMEDRMRADFPAKVHHVLPATGGKPRRLLDVGCGKGFFVKACADRGVDAQGIDLSETGVAYARDHARRECDRR